MTWILHSGACLDGLRALGEHSVDHVLTDPPYEAEAHTQQRRVKRGEVMAVEPLSFAPIGEEERHAVAREIARIARRWMVVFCQIEGAPLWRKSLESAGAVYRRTCIWVKPDGMPQYSGDRPGMGYEALVVAHAPGRSEWNGGGRHGVFTVNKNDPERTGHPTQKPRALMETLVRLFTDPGELVCDPFAGSGTTGVAALRLGRRFLGWELDPAFYAVASRRLGATRQQLDLFETGGAQLGEESAAGHTRPNGDIDDADSKAL